MSFLKKLAECVIATVRRKNLTNKISNNFFDILRGESTKVQSGKTRCPTQQQQRQQQPRRKRDTKAIYYRSHCAKPYPLCGVRAESLKTCRPQRTWLLDVEKCCNELCKWAHPRFDDLYYMPSDKLNIKYQCTWCEFQPIYVLERNICCHEQTNYPVAKRRKPKKPIPICEDMRTCRLALVCRNHLSKRCAKLTWPGCKPAREPPDCKLKRIDCGSRPATPYPCFSECRKEKVIPLRPIECRCLKYEPRCVAR